MSRAARTQTPALRQYIKFLYAHKWTQCRIEASLKQLDAVLAIITICAESTVGVPLPAPAQECLQEILIH